MKIALVDDEQTCLDELAQLCHDFGAQNNYLIETVPFTNAEAFLDAFDRGSFSVVFMDIYLNDMNGITAALRMRSLDPRCVLVFVTSSADFMPEAFSCHAFEYVTKPFSKERIFDVLSDAVKILPQEQKYMELTADRKSIRIFFGEIVSAVTDAHYLDITLTDGKKLRCRMTMPEFLEKTNGDSRFIPVNKGIAANAEYILEFEMGCCTMENGAKFPVRVRDSAKVEQMVRDYHFEKIRGRQSHSAGSSAPGDSAGKRRRKEE